MKVLTEEEYLDLHGVSYLEGAEPALHRLSGGLSKIRKGKVLKKVHSRMLENEPGEMNCGSLTPTRWKPEPSGRLPAWNG